MIKNIIKRNGTTEAYDPEKIHEKVLLATEGLAGVAPSEIIMNASLFIQEGSSSSDIQDALISSCDDLFGEETPNYQYAGARLLNQKLRKEVYKQYEPLDFYSEVKKRIDAGIYDPDLLENYTKEEIDYFGTKLKFHRDDTFTYIGLKQLYSKYLIHKNGLPVETPQEVFMLINMYVFMQYPEDKRKKWVLEGYRALSTHEASLPTPDMNGIRTNYKRFISCNLINAGDTTKSLGLASAYVMMMTANKSGIGLNASFIRGLDADIGDGRLKHTGQLPILKTFEAATSAFTQVGRGGSSTNNYPFFHYEIMHTMVLGNAKGTDETRVRQADHTIILNKLLLERIVNEDTITLFHINEVPGLIENIGNYDKFKELYEGYEKTVSDKHKIVLPAKSFEDKFLTERSLQNRLYYILADNAFNQGSWKHYDWGIMSNLCLEIIQPAYPLDQDNAEIGVCILGNVNHGHCSDERLQPVCEWLVRFKEELIDYMDYSHDEIRKAAVLRRPLGLGDSDVFHYLAKNKEFYNTKSGRNFLHKRLESRAYYMYEASIKLAEEKGPCELLKDTKYSEGWFTIDSYNKSIDEICSEELHHDWEALRAKQLKHGQRHSTLFAVPPAGNSAKPSNSTSGVEPPRQLLTVKDDKKVKTKQLVPDYSKYKNYYTTAWGPDFSNEEYFKTIGVVQKFVDQAISTNQYTNLMNYKGGKVPMSVLLRELLIANKYGLKTAYYQNTRSTNEADGLDTQEGCGNGGCSV